MFDPTEPNHTADHREAHADSGRHPLVTLRDICSRPIPQSHVIVFANEKGGVGKSTLAFHCAVALCDAGEDVAVVDLDQRQQSLSRILEHRDATARCLGIDLPSPEHIVLRNSSGAQLVQEISRIGSRAGFVVIDVAGSDSAVARYAIGMADTLVTPVNCSSVDLELLGRFCPVSKQFKEAGHFAQLVSELREARCKRGFKPLDWVVLKNRMRTAERRQQAHVDHALRQLSSRIGLRLGHGLSERVAYRELLPFGLCHLDLKRIPGLARMQERAGEEVLRLIEDLALPLRNEGAPSRRPKKTAKVSRKVSEAFDASLHAHMHPDLARLS